MPLRTEVSPAEMGEAMRLNRTRMYWPTVFLHCWWVTAPLIVIFWGEITRLIDGGPIRPASLGGLLLQGLFLWLNWYCSQEAVKMTLSQNSHRKGSASIDGKGFSASYASGATLFVPWSEFSGWKEGEGVFTLMSGKTFRVFSKHGLSEPELEELRSLFRCQIG